MTTLLKSILFLMLLGFAAVAKSKQTDVSVYQAIFPIEVDETSSTPPANLEQRPIFILMDKVSVASTLNKTGHTYMLARDATFRVIQEKPLTNPPDVHLVFNGLPSCRLHVVSEVVISLRNDDASGAKGLKGDGCVTHRNYYGAMAVVGKIDQVMSVDKAPTFPAPTLELQQIPEGMSPNSSTAKIVIPEMNRMRRAEYETALRDVEARKQAAVVNAKKKGNILDTDERLKPFVESVKKDEKRKGFVPTLYILSPGGALVYFTHSNGRAFTMSFDPNGREQVKETPQ